MEHHNFTDKMIDDFFKKNDISSVNFFSKLENTIKSSQTSLKIEYDKLVQENEYHGKRINETQNDYSEKLDLITNLYTNFETRVDHLGKVYSDKLSYISVLSSNLAEFENFKSNIIFSNKILDYFDMTNKVEDINKSIPDIFTQPTKMLQDGVEVFEAFRQFIDTNTGREYPNFSKNFYVIEQRIKQCVQDSIRDFYENNQLDKLEKLMKVTEKFDSEFIIDLYVKYIIDTMDLNSLIKSVENISYLKMSEEMFTHIFKIIDEFHNNITKACYEQYGRREGRIYLFFPLVKQKIVISSLVTQIAKNLSNFRQIITNEKDKSNEVYVRIIEYFYPESQKFVKDFQNFSDEMKIDFNDIDENTRIFLRSLEGIYISKEKSLFDNFIRLNYESKMKRVSEIKNQYVSKQLTLDKLKSDTYNLIESTNLSLIHQYSVKTINRIIKLIMDTNERIDMVDTYCNSVMDSIKNLLIYYCNLIKILYVESEKSNIISSGSHYTIFSRINFLYKDFQQIFLYDLKDLFKSLKFNEVIEDKIKKRINEVNTAVEQLFNQLSAYIYSSLNQCLSTVKYKETYHNVKPKNQYGCSVEFENICNVFLKPVFIAVRLYNFIFISRFMKICQKITELEYVKQLLRQFLIN